MILPTNLPQEKIATFAEEVAGALSYQDDHNIDRVVEALGGRIFFNDFWEDTAKTGSLLVSELGKFEIFVPSHTTQERDRFTIAHELGHYILHYLYNLNPREQAPFQINRYGRGPVEDEANLFAYSFLMPKIHFENAYQEMKGNLTAVAKKFRVSETAARNRAKMLGLNGERTARAIRGAADVPAA